MRPYWHLDYEIGYQCSAIVRPTKYSGSRRPYRLFRPVAWQLQVNYFIRQKTTTKNAWFSNYPVCECVRAGGRSCCTHKPSRHTFKRLSCVVRILLHRKSTTKHAPKKTTIAQYSNEYNHLIQPASVQNIHDRRHFASYGDKKVYESGCNELHGTEFLES